ncbi:hypothetical protein DCAR_0101964 [Daucus carota subsp. sativus]|uniref:non-specific serine/threonine protein kinase n=2 Tax=Daucus carota subsp. sativus TaxID=79200 RepID=A0AAF0W620_DAUCS|nr:hypothetical protein DCAR_0101964 [Daucus carota subsp. sativus]
MSSMNKGSESDDNSTSNPEASASNSKMHTRWRKFVNVWKVSPIKKLPLIPPKQLSKKSSSASENVAFDLSNFNSPWKNFSLQELQNATCNFSPDNLIGKGGYAEVFKGSLTDGQLVAVKKLNKGTSEEQIVGFLSEIGTIAHVDHPNTAKMVGYGVEGGTYLILELSPLGSLGSLLHGKKERLDWGARHKIIVGTADGLLYLHENCQRRIIHRDIKADNILLTENFEPQICDFGLAKWLPKQWSHHNVSKFEGTFGYFAPEYFMHGIVDEKTDVYSFGVLILEIVTGRRAIDDSQKSLVLWAKPLLESSAIEELVDPSLGSLYNQEEMDCVLLTASVCIDQNPILRPRMSQVLEILRGDKYDPHCPRVQQKRLLQRTYSEEINDAEEYNSTKYLHNVDRLKEIALET